MIRSVLINYKKYVFLAVVVLLAAVHFGFKPAMDEQQMLDWGNRCFAEAYDASGDASLKKYELVLTDDAFVRLRKTYQNGRQEYFSFQLHRLNDMDYFGTTDGGTLRLKTVADDIIVQTYNDRKGDIDSMATQLDIPVKNIQPERLDSLQMVLNYFKNKSL